MTATGASIYICSDDSKTTVPDAPINREWHELGHYLQFQMYNAYQDPTGESHLGYQNNSTNDSVIEGFSEFVAMLVAEGYGMLKPPYYHPLYPVDKGIYNIEEDYKVWGKTVSPIKRPDGTIEMVTTFFGLPEDEEFAVAGILWDLHDKSKEINLKHYVADGADGPIWVEVSKVYPASTDQISLSAQKILEVINEKKPTTVVDLYNAFQGTVPKQDLDMIFVNHGAFADVADRNLIHDKSGEQVGLSGHKPERMDRSSPAPTSPGSYLVSDADGKFNIEIIHEEPFSQYDFSYQLNMTGNEPAYFVMPPRYYPSKAIFNQISESGETVVSNSTTINSNEYWDYILSDPPRDGVFKNIPVRQAAAQEEDIGIPSNASTPQPSANQTSTSTGGGCLIATAAFGSELAPQVQFLRNFRDQHVLSTRTGSSFMNVFNAWYYSFSPYVADYERQVPLLQQTVRIAIYPLLGILGLSETAYFLIPGEYGSVLAGLIASSLIGAIYFSPVALSVKQVRRLRLNVKIVALIMLTTFAAILFSLMVGDQNALMVTTPFFVVMILAVSMLYSAKGIIRAARKFGSFFKE